MLSQPHRISVGEIVNVIHCKKVNKTMASIITEIIWFKLKGCTEEKGKP